MSIDPAGLPTHGVSASALRALATALESGQLSAPLTRFALLKAQPLPEALTSDLIRLTTEGLSARHLALLLRTAAGGVSGDTGLPIELVWTGPEAAISQSRDTAVVVDELFASAAESVLVSTFVVQQAGTIFATLGRRLDERPDIRARVFLHVPRDWKDSRDDSELLREFGDRFRKEWPGSRRPAVFYDPRSLSTDAGQRATWHAKCVIVDDAVSLVTSANFTEWAQQRNVEAGVLIRDAGFSTRLRRQFESLVQLGLVKPVP